MSKFFRNIFLTYIILLVIILVVFLFLYTRSSLIIEDKIVASRIASLEQISTSLDHSFMDIINSVNQVAIDPQVRSFMNISEPYSGPNVIRIIETMGALRSIHMASHFVIDTYVVYDNNVIVSSTVASALDAFFPYRLSIEGLCHQAWRELVFSATYARFIPAASVSFTYHGFAVGGFNVEYDAIQYIMPLRDLHGTRGAVVTFINNLAIQRIFHDVYMESGEWGFILSASGEVISTIGYARSIADIPMPENRAGSVRFSRNGVNYLMSYVRSDMLGWTYVSVMESNYVLAELNEFRQMFLLAVFVMSAVTLLLSIVFSIRNFRPIKRLQGTLDKQMPILRHAFIQDIFDGKLFASDDIAESTASLSLDLSGKAYGVVVISGKDSPMDLTQLTKAHILVDGYTVPSTLSDVKRYSLNLAKNVLAILLISGNDSLKQYIREFSDTMVEDLHSEGIHNINIGIGGIYSQLTDVYKSYAKAVEAIQYFMVIDRNRAVCVFDDMPNNNEFYYYPEEEEQRLLNMVRSGEIEGIRTLINEICNENLINRHLSHNMMSAFINHLCQGIFKIGRPSIISEEVKEKVDDLYGTLYQLTDLEKLMHSTRLYSLICEDIYHKKHGKTQNKINIIVEEIKTMCDEKFHDPEICLTGFATKYNLSETYLSLQFKEHTGENFYNYLQCLRIDMAAKLLSDSNLTILEISERVGYGSYNTFAKAFKRKTGINASDYRKSGNM